MTARPLPGAPYHTADFAFHSSSDVDLEAVDSYGPSEKELSTSERRIHLPLQTYQRTAHLRRGPPVMLILLLLCCLAFVVSAFTGSASADRFSFPLPCVPERHAPLADQTSAAFRTEPHMEWVYETQARALDILCVRKFHLQSYIVVISLAHRAQQEAKVQYFSCWLPRR